MGRWTALYVCQDPKKNTISVIRQKTGKETLLGWFENQVIVKKDIFEFEVKVTDAAALLKVC